MFLDHDSYIRDPMDDFPEDTIASYEANTTLPAVAVDTGYRRDGAAIWRVPGERDEIYWVTPDAVEQLPREKPQDHPCI